MNDPATLPLTRTTELVGAYRALSFGVVLLAAFALLAIARRTERPAALEEIVPVPVPAITATPTPAVLAPDPGDNP